jgi:hypothetical protein
MGYAGRVHQFKNQCFLPRVDALLLRAFVRTLSFCPTALLAILDSDRRVKDEEARNYLKRFEKNTKKRNREQREDEQNHRKRLHMLSSSPFSSRSRRTFTPRRSLLYSPSSVSSLCSSWGLEGERTLFFMTAVSLLTLLWSSSSSFRIWSPVLPCVYYRHTLRVQVNSRCYFESVQPHESSRERREQLYYKLLSPVPSRIEERQNDSRSLKTRKFRSLCLKLLPPPSPTERETFLLQRWYSSYVSHWRTLLGAPLVGYCDWDFLTFYMEGKRLRS